MKNQWQQQKFPLSKSSQIIIIFLFLNIIAFFIKNPWNWLYLAIDFLCLTIIAIICRLTTEDFVVKNYLSIFFSIIFSILSLIFFILFFLKKHEIKLSNIKNKKKLSKLINFFYLFIFFTSCLLFVFIFLK